MGRQYVAHDARRSRSGIAVKVISVVPGNTGRGLPVTNGVMVLNDSQTGIPLAIMNAAALTAQRTGAVGALGIKYLTPQETFSAGIVGCGVQGAWQAIFACAVRPIKELFVFSRSRAGFERFAATVSRHAPGPRMTPCRDARELLERTDLVIAATTSSEPVLPDEPKLLENKHFISVGSYRPTMQEFPNSVYQLAGLLAVDSEHARHEVGDVINPLRKNLLKETDVFSIGECVTGNESSIPLAPPPTNPSAPLCMTYLSRKRSIMPQRRKGSDARLISEKSMKSLFEDWSWQAPRALDADHDDRYAYRWRAFAVVTSSLPPMEDRTVARPKNATS